MEQLTGEREAHRTPGSAVGVAPVERWPAVVAADTAPAPKKRGEEGSVPVWPLSPPPSSHPFPGGEVGHLMIMLWGGLMIFSGKGGFSRARVGPSAGTHHF